MDFLLLSPVGFMPEQAHLYALAVAACVSEFAMLEYGLSASFTLSTGFTSEEAHVPLRGPAALATAGVIATASWLALRIANDAL